MQTKYHARLRGIVLCVKSSLERYCVLLKKENDDVVWLRLNKSLLYLSFDLYLFVCYIIPTGSSREALTGVSVLIVLPIIVRNL